MENLSHSQKRQNDALEQVNSIYLQALNSADAGIIITNNTLLDNPIIYCNDAFVNMTGYSREEVIGHNCRFLQADDTQQEVKKLLKQSIENKESCKVEIRNYKKDGTLFWNELSVSPIINQDQSVTHFIGIQNDVTELRENEKIANAEKVLVEKKIEKRTQELHDSEAFLSSIIQTVRESLVVLDADYKVLSVNSHFLRVFKVNQEDTIGKVLFELGNHQWDIEKFKILLTKILPTNNPVIDFEVEHDFPHIGKKTMLVNAYRIEFEGQYKDRILIAIEDITDKKEMDRRKDDFLSIASHELKTPITTIKGLAQILHRLAPEESSEKYKSFLTKMNVSVDRLNNLVTELLSSSKIQSGNFEMHKTFFRISDIVQESVENIALAYPQYQIILKNDCTEMILGDEPQISQVLNNLITNAIKYSPDSNRIEVHSNRVGNFVKISVIDFGIGIDKHDKNNIFKRFFRVKEVQKKFPGMGIGLYISHETVTNHEGTLWVESEIGKGSTFSFTLPIKNNDKHGE